jgi:predicted transposase/invertase (TIGR01784 family)
VEENMRILDDHPVVKVFEEIFVERGIKKGIERGIEQGIERGIERGIIQTALSMLKDGVELAVISKYTGFDTERVKMLEKELLAQA